MSYQLLTFLLVKNHKTTDVIWKHISRTMKYPYCHHCFILKKKDILFQFLPHFYKFVGLYTVLILIIGNTLRIICFIHEMILLFLSHFLLINGMVLDSHHLYFGIFIQINLKKDYFTYRLPQIL